MVLRVRTDDGWGVSDSVRDGYAEVGAVPELELVVGVRSNN